MNLSCFSACDLYGLGILVFGLQTRNLHPGEVGWGGQGKGIWRVEDGSAGGQRGGKNGLSLSPPSSRLLLAHTPSLLMCSAAPAVLHSLSQGHMSRS